MAAFHPRSIPVVLFFLLLNSVPLYASLSQPASSVFDILPRYGLPSGLLPSSVKSYSLSDDGSFVVELQKPCYIQFDYLVYYETHITGTLKYGSITKLDGIQVQKFFLWLSVDEIKVDLPASDSIYFQVGPVNKKLDIDQFKTIHGCRDSKGLSCLHSWKDILQLPPPLDDEIPMLVTD